MRDAHGFDGELLKVSIVSHYSSRRLVEIAKLTNLQLQCHCGDQNIRGTSAHAHMFTVKTGTIERHCPSFGGAPKSVTQLEDGCHSEVSISKLFEINYSNLRTEPQILYNHVTRLFVATIFLQAVEMGTMPHWAGKQLRIPR